jgi:hypothetical protein
MGSTRCWQDWNETLTEEEELENIMEMSKTCLLESDHNGPHEWTNDDEFSIKFKNKGNHELDTRNL